MQYRKFDSEAIYSRFVGYNEWRQAAMQGMQELCAFRANPANEGKSTPVDSELYGRLKPYLVKYFWQKCAYCESNFTAVAFGDVEHYRPKRKVQEYQDHPGYYWLAYREDNLVPCCQLCNQGRGKRNHFPIAGVYATCSDANLPDERPLLLNPYDASQWHDAPHFRYEFRMRRGEVWPTGQMVGMTPQGLESLRIYNLNRRALVKRRRRSQYVAITTIKEALIKNTFEAVYNSQFNPSREYASAVQAACHQWKENHIAKLMKLR